MKISDELADQLLDVTPQLENRFGIKVGYSHPCGAFLDEKDDFILYQDGVYNPEINDIAYGSAYLLEANLFQQNRESILVEITTDLEQKTDRLVNFIIDLVQWLKSGELKVEKYRKYKHWEWKPVGDGRFSVHQMRGNLLTGYSEHLGNFNPEDKELEEHIAAIYMGN